MCFWVKRGVVNTVKGHEVRQHLVVGESPIKNSHLFTLLISKMHKHIVQRGLTQTIVLYRRGGGA